MLMAIMPLAEAETDSSDGPTVAMPAAAAVDFRKRRRVIPARRVSWRVMDGAPLFAGAFGPDDVSFVDDDVFLSQNVNDVGCSHKEQNFALADAEKASLRERRR
jgi:hypothetical protein